MCVAFGIWIGEDGMSVGRVDGDCNKEIGWWKWVDWEVEKEELWCFQNLESEGGVAWRMNGGVWNVGNVFAVCVKCINEGEYDNWCYVFLW